MHMGGRDGCPIPYRLRGVEVRVLVDKESSVYLRGDNQTPL